MDKAFTGSNGLELFFLICAGAGGLLFMVRLILQFTAAGHDFHSGLDAAHGDLGHGDADTSFKVLTLHGLTSFFIMFGLVGLALHRQSRAGGLFSVIGGVAVGLATVWIIGKIFSSAKKLQSSGTVDIVGAIGCEGTVYATIPEKGTGCVQIILKNRLREFDAVSQKREEIRTGEHIRVVWVNGNILVVEKT